MRKISFILFAVILIVACNDSGGWSKLDESKWMNSCMGQLQGNPDAKNICSCVLQKAEKAFHTYTEEETKGTAEQGTQWTKECMNGNNRNGGGILNNNNNNNNTNNNIGRNWSQDDQQKVMNECMNHVAMNLDNTIRQKFCDCFVGKMMQKYANYNELDRNTTVEEGKQITQDCMNGLDVNGGNVNNNLHTTWTNDDEQKFMNTCLKNAMNAGADRQTATVHCSCTLKKIEVKYQSYNEANQKMTPDEVTVMERECNQEQNQ